MRGEISLIESEELEIAQTENNMATNIKIQIVTAMHLSIDDILDGGILDEVKSENQLSSIQEYQSNQENERMENDSSDSNILTKASQ